MTLLYHLLPELVLLTVGLLLIIAKITTGSARSMQILAIAGYITTLVVLVLALPSEKILFGGLYVVDDYSRYFKGLVIVTAILILLAAKQYVQDRGLYQSEFYILFTFALLGMVVLISAGDIITFYMGLELMTLSLVVLVGYVVNAKLGTEASLKYLLLSALSSAILLYGLSLLYGITGTISLVEMSSVFRFLDPSPLLVVAVVMVLAGFLFKISGVPFHMWAPDIYHGAPTPITAFLGSASKVAAFAVMIRLFHNALGAQYPIWSMLLIVVSVLTILLGNLVAIPQTNIKRMMAYSSIAQAGYIIFGLIAAGELGTTALIYYSSAYVFANTLVFVAIIAVENHIKSDEINDYRGLARRSPLLAAALFVGLVSLAGLPPTAGFVGKFLLFSAIIDAGHLALAFLGILMSMVSVYYYFCIVKAVYITPMDEDADQISTDLGTKIAIALCITATIVLGVFFGDGLDAMIQAAQSLIF